MSFVALVGAERPFPQNVEICEAAARIKRFWTSAILASCSQKWKQIPPFFAAYFVVLTSVEATAASRHDWIAKRAFQGRHPMLIKPAPTRIYLHLAIRYPLWDHQYFTWRTGNAANSIRGLAIRRPRLKRSAGGLLAFRGSRSAWNDL
jgi:hypothetical protein